jgi:hypothetical protein
MAIKFEMNDDKHCSVEMKFKGLTLQMNVVCDADALTPNDIHLVGLLTGVIDAYVDNITEYAAQHMQESKESH